MTEFRQRTYNGSDRPIIGTARIVLCGAGVYETVRCPPVCPSVCPIRTLQQRAAGLLLWARRVGDIDRLL